jgi:hypothetical protein
MNDSDIKQHCIILLGCNNQKGEKLELNYGVDVVALCTSMWECIYSKKLLTNDKK